MRSRQPGWALLLALALAACSPTPESDPSEDVRRPAVDFRLEQLGGGEVALSDWAGKPVILDFWATWCPPCEFQVPELNALFQAHREANDVGIFGISIDEGGPEIVREWVAAHGVDYPILLSDGDLARHYGAVGFPTFVLIAPDGRVEWTHAGVIDRKDIESRLAKFVPSP